MATEEIMCCEDFERAFHVLLAEKAVLIVSMAVVIMKVSQLAVTPKGMTAVTDMKKEKKNTTRIIHSNAIRVIFGRRKEM